MEEILSKHQGERIMTVVHWGILGILTQYLQGKDIYAWRTIGPWTACGISEFCSNDGHWQTIRLNDGRHLK
jgi:broad specificity phosphatase PhoE